MPTMIRAHTALDFDESKHPRAANGRWGSGGTSETDGWTKDDIAAGEAYLMSTLQRSVEANWQSGNFDGEVMRAAATDVLEGKVSTDPNDVDSENALSMYHQDTYAIMAAAQQSPPTDEQVYRGMRIMGTPEDVYGDFRPGKELDIPVASFSRDPGAAASFASGAAYTPVIITCEPGASMLDVAAISSNDRVDDDEQELIASGRFKVLTREMDPRDGIVEVRIKQVAAFELGHPPGAPSDYVDVMVGRRERGEIQ